MTLDILDAVVIGALFCLIMYLSFLYNAKVVNARRLFHDRTESALQKLRDPPEPKHPELVCTCGDCWELGDAEVTGIECGCGRAYRVFQSHEDDQ